MTRLALGLVFILALVAGGFDWQPPMQNGPKPVSHEWTMDEMAWKAQGDTIPWAEAEQGRRMLVTEMLVPDTGDAFRLRPVATAVVSDRSGNHADRIPDVGELAEHGAPAVAVPKPAETTVEVTHEVRGLATWYGSDFAGFPTASGTPYDPTGFTAASNQYRLGTRLLVVYGRTVEVEVTDRGDFTHALDLSMAAFEALAPLDLGVIDVMIREVR